ncbi:MAG: flagellar hook-length control protein FliK [Rhodanobacter sp.]
MTASAIVTVTAPPAAAGQRSAGAPRDDAGSGAPKDFGSQLHAARQEHDERARQGVPDSRDGSRPASATPPSPGRQSDTAEPTGPAALPAAAAQAEAPAAPANRDEPDDQPAVAVAGAMLALLGSSVAAALQPVAGKAGAAAEAGKAVDAGAAVMLQLDPAGGPGAARSNVLPSADMPGMAHAEPSAAAIGKEAPEGHGLAMALPAPPAAAAPAVPHQLQLPSPPGSPAFAQDLGHQVAWLGGQDIKQARIRLHPEELGSLDVSVSVTHGRVDVVFSAQHAAAVPAVQQSLPQLDQMLARHGLSLGHAEVGQHDRGDRRGQGGNTGAAAGDEIADVHGGMPVTLGKVGLLDAFA